MHASEPHVAMVASSIQTCLLIPPLLWHSLSEVLGFLASKSHTSSSESTPAEASTPAALHALNEVLVDVWGDRYRDRVLGEEARVERLALAGALEPGGALAAAPLKEYVGDRVRGTLCAFADTFATDPNDMSGLALEEDEDWHGIDDVLLGIKARVADDLLGDLAEEAMAEVLRVREALRRRGESAAATNNGH